MIRAVNTGDTAFDSSGRAGDRAVPHSDMAGVLASAGLAFYYLRDHRQCACVDHAAFIVLHAAEFRDPADRGDIDQ